MALIRSWFTSSIGFLRGLVLRRNVIRSQRARARRTEMPGWQGPEDFEHRF